MKKKDKEMWIKYMSFGVNALLIVCIVFIASWEGKICGFALKGYNDCKNGEIFPVSYGDIPEWKQRISGDGQLTCYDTNEINTFFTKALATNSSKNSWLNETKQQLIDNCENGLFMGVNGLTCKQKKDCKDNGYCKDGGWYYFEKQ